MIRSGYLSRLQASRLLLVGSDELLPLSVITDVMWGTSRVHPSVDGSLTQSWFRRGDSVDSCLFPACVMRFLWPSRWQQM